MVLTDSYSTERGSGDGKKVFFPFRALANFLSVCYCKFQSPVKKRRFL